MSLLLDECITLPVARALQAASFDVVYSPDVVGIGAKDGPVYDYAVTHGMAVLTQDREMGSDRIKQDTVLGKGCRVFILRRPKKGDSTRLKLMQILNLWVEIEKRIKGVGPPYIFECRAKGVHIERIR